MSKEEEEKIVFDVAIIGGSYSGLSCAMALGRSLKKVVVIDTASPCNRFANQSHNFLGHDYWRPESILANARNQIRESYSDYVQFEQETVDSIERDKKTELFAVNVTGGVNTLHCRKVVFCSGITDKTEELGIENIDKFWGRTVIHCPYCHGFENKKVPTGLLLSHPDKIVFMTPKIYNWASELAILTNGKLSKPFTDEQLAYITKRPGVKIIDKEIKRFQGDEKKGQLAGVEFTDGTTEDFKCIYTMPPFDIRNRNIIDSLGVRVNSYGLVDVGNFQETSVKDVFAAGDCANFMRSIATAVQQGQLAGISVNTQLCKENWENP